MNNIQIRTPQEVAKRALILLGIFQAATGREKSEVINILKNNNLWREVSEVEKNFLLKTSEETKFEALQFGWRSEAVFILLWALKLVDVEEIPTDETNLDLIVDLLKHSNFYEKININKAQLRESREIFDLLDMIHKIHWDLRDARLQNNNPSHNYHPSIIYEWHYTLNWIVRPNEDWDYITTDT
ncbi:MAG: DUF4272 domain-containing protein [Promethearchaeota archaeon]